MYLVHSDPLYIHLSTWLPFPTRRAGPGQPSLLAQRRPSTLATERQPSSGVEERGPHASVGLCYVGLAPPRCAAGPRVVGKFCQIDRWMYKGSEGTCLALGDGFLRAQIRQTPKCELNPYLSPIGVGTDYGNPGDCCVRWTSAVRDSLPGTSPFWSARVLTLGGGVRVGRFSKAVCQACWAVPNSRARRLRRGQ